MQSNLTREDRDLIHDVVSRLSYASMALDSYGDQVKALAIAKRLMANEAVVLVERIDEMLRDGGDTGEISLVLNVDEALVIERENILGDRGDLGDEPSFV